MDLTRVMFRRSPRPTSSVPPWSATAFGFEVTQVPCRASHCTMPNP